jgi:hypothetical protein
VPSLPTAYDGADRDVPAGLTAMRYCLWTKERQVLVRMPASARR